MPTHVAVLGQHGGGGRGRAVRDVNCGAG
jgi:hypothetical protein